MKKINLILTIITLSFTIGCKAQSQLEQLNNYKTLILGTWVSEDDSSHKIEFTSKNTCKIYIDNELEETYEYLLDTACGKNSNNGYDVFLKTLTDINSSTCDIINNIHVDSNGVTTLSITTERGQLEIYLKNKN
ncbi:MAG: hypothetical protein ACON5F_11870 [Jejuia sp.]